MAVLLIQARELEGFLQGDYAIIVHGNLTVEGGSRSGV
jgi:hypothetical protein